jgi:hypothetical protein
MKKVTGRISGQKGAPLRGDKTIAGSEVQVFDPVMRSLHGLTLFLIAGVFSTAALIDHEAPDGQKVFLLQLYRSLGLSIWVLTLIRLAWRQFARLPDWPAGMRKAMQVAARCSELVIYALLMVQPVLRWKTRGCGKLFHSRGNKRPSATVSLATETLLAGVLRCA